MAGFMEAGGSNHGGPFVTSRETMPPPLVARGAMADLFNAARTRGDLVRSEHDEYHVVGE